MFDFVFDAAQFGEFLATGLRLSMPLIFAAMGGLLCERAGVFNIALEGQLLLGAFGAALGAHLTGMAGGGVAVALVFGAASGLGLALLGVTLRVNQIVVGIAVILFAIGFTSFMSRVAFEGGGNSLRLDGFRPIDIPILSDIPVIGPVLFAQDLLFYLMLAVVAAIQIVLFRTGLGLSIRAVGESPATADAAGVPVFTLRYGVIVAGSMIASLGGAYIVLSQVFLFSDNMSAGKGFIGLAAIVLGRWNPVLALLACLLFGLFDAFQLRLQFQSPDMPFQVFAALPYVISIMALVGLIGRAQPPAAVGRPYDREMR
ncbi:ABC transporter permease [Aquibium sp. A9E412]|uniref:ABC transporter permease n=1 Tax=Aquibium sp. A9E412 TaxID=2976767 RepID=UPI0025B0CAC3|nr:ABC transporter permease [Aquibium sp. A9E412]MDN2565537.1 ABC transporter permease [Aquibium sp. A9E412]